MVKGAGVADNMILSSIISSLAALAALALAPKMVAFICQPEARLSEGTLPDSLVFIFPGRDAELSQILHQLNMHSATRQRQTRPAAFRRLRCGSGYYNGARGCGGVSKR